MCKKQKGTLLQYCKPGEFQQQLLGPSMVEAHRGFLVLSRTLHVDHLAPSETLMLNDDARNDPVVLRRQPPSCGPSLG